PPARVRQVRKCRLAVRAPRHDAPGHADDRPLVGGAEELDRRSRLVRPAVSVGIRGDPARDERVEFLPARAHHEVEVLAVVGHAIALAAPCCFRYSSMNGSMAPSITFWTS